MSKTAKPTQAPRKSQKYLAYVVPSTHWDRAWYSPFELFRTRLTETVDNLLDLLERRPDYKAFTFDGQSVILEDYLEIFPEGEAKLRKYITNGRLTVGPWYVLPDEFLVSGEALIRNLQRGIAVAERFGRSMKVGYVPDPFGHVSQMPQILRGFGLDSFIFSRGMGDAADTVGTDFAWVAPDGETWVWATQQVNGYGNLCAWGIPNGEPADTEKIDYQSAYDRVNNLVNDFKRFKPTTHFLLFNNGVDHFPAQPSVPAMIKYINSKQDFVRLIQGDFEDYVRAVQKEKPQLRKYQGEMHEGKYHSLLSGVFSARMYLKQSNYRAQTQLEKYAEPLCAWAWTAGETYPKEYLWYSWREVLRCHPHDDICGCSVDPVHQDMVNRFTRALQVSEHLAETKFRQIVEKINTEAGIPGAPIVVYNPTSTQRTAVVKCWVGTYAEYLDPTQPVAILDSHCRPQIAQIKLTPAHEITQWVEGKAIPRQSVEADVEFLAENIPPCGYETYVLANYAGPVPQSPMAVGYDRIANEFYEVKVLRTGEVDILDKLTGKRFRGCNVFEDTEDVGDEYDYSPLPAAQSSTVTSLEKARKIKVRLAENTQTCAALGIEMELMVPEAISEDRKSRSPKEVPLAIRSVVRLVAGVPRVEFTTTVDNQAQDHRLRAIFPTGIQTDKTHAESKFDVVTRDAAPRQVDGWAQAPVGTQHVDSFVSLDDGRYGFTLINRGLPEYEAKPGKNGVTMCQTLFRACGFLSREDLLTRHGNAGPTVSVPDAQCPGPNTYHYAVTTHEGNWEAAKAWQQAHQFTAPVMVQPTGMHTGTQPVQCCFVETKPDSLVVTAMKKSDREAAFVVRCYNIGTRAVQGKLTFLRELKSAYLVNMNEEHLEKLPIAKDNSLRVKVGMKHIVTVAVTFK